MTAQMYLSTFYVRQRFAMMTNRYELYAAAPDGGWGQLMGLAEQKVLAFREQVTFFSDETRSRPVYAFRARQVMDFGASLLRSTFHVEGPGFAGTGQERSQLVGLLRRFTEIPFLPVHFDFAGPDGAPLVSVEREATVRDRYTVHVPDDRVDFRVAAALAVGLDALMQR